jgi:hypothetical protein
MRGHSRFKNGDASLADMPGMHVLAVTQAKMWMAGLKRGRGKGRGEPEARRLLTSVSLSTSARFPGDNRAAA